MNVGEHLGSVSVSWWRPLQLESGVGMQWFLCSDVLNCAAASMDVVRERQSRNIMPALRPRVHRTKKDLSVDSSTVHIGWSNEWLEWQAQAKK